MSKLRIVLVSYINTIPFIEGIRASEILKDKVELLIDYPAKCAEMIENKEVDGGLIPVGALSGIDGYQVFTDYCIGANGAVESVALFSQKPISEVDSIFLDYQSRTSVKLVQVLAQKFWKKDIKFLPTTKGYESQINDNSAILIIGDRVFEYEHLYKYKLDLAEEWKKHTKMPFAFALWVANDRLKLIEDELNKVFSESIKNIPQQYSNLLTISREKFVNYLTQKIDYNYDTEKKKAVKLFTSMLNSRS